MTAIDYGPQAPQVEALITRIGVLTTDEVERLVAAWDAARDAALDATWYAARDATWYVARYDAWCAARYAARYDAWCAARDAAWNAAWNAALDARYASRYAVLALVVRDLIPTKHYDTLTTPWRQVVGPIHPDDPDLREDAP